MECDRIVQGRKTWSRHPLESREKHVGKPRVKWISSFKSRTFFAAGERGVGGMREERRLSSGRVKRCGWNERRAQAEQWTSREVWVE